MMHSNVLELLREKHDQLSPGGKRIADFVLANPEETVYLSAAELSYRCEVSESCVIRFCKGLNMESLRYFRFALTYALALQKEESKKQDGIDLSQMEPLILQITSTAEQLSGCITQLTNVLSHNPSTNNIDL